MPDLKDRTTLDLDEDLSFQLREWRASRVLLPLLLLTMAATGLGLFGNGPLSHAHVEAAGGGLSVEYDRFARFGASTRLKVLAPARADGATDVALSQSLVESFLVTQIVPAPAATEVGADVVRYRFAARPDSRAPIIFDLQPRRRWTIAGQVRSGSDAVSLRAFIYP